MAGLLGGSFGGDDSTGLLSGFFGNNRNMLMSAGAALMSGNTLNEGLGKLGPAVIHGMQGDQQQQLLRASYGAMVSRGMDPQLALLAVANPKFMEGAVKQLMPEFQFKEAGQLYGPFNPATGGFSVQGTSPKFEKVGPGETGAYVTPPTPASLPAASAPAPMSRAPVPSSPKVWGDAEAEAAGLYDKPAAPRVASAAAPAATAGLPATATPVLSGGPEKAPAGFSHIDPKNPNAGLAAIPGGPATQIPSETAGRLAMMDTALKDYQKSKDVLLRNRGALGHDPISSAQWTLNAGEVGRATRNMRVAVEAALRAMTGAAATPEETKRYTDMFVPNPADSDVTAKQKMQLLEEFMHNAHRTVSQGRTPNPVMPKSDPLGIR